MNKTQLLLLGDYSKDPSDIRLSLFAKSYHPSIKLSKSDRVELKTLISDFQQDPSTIRKKLIDSHFSGLSGISGKGPTPSPTIDSTYAMTDESNFKTLLDPLGDLEGKRIVELSQSLSELYRRLNNDPNNKELREQVETGKRELFKLENAKGLYGDSDPQAQEKSEISVLKGILGDWEKETSIAHELLYGQKASLQIKSPLSLKNLLVNLEKYSGHKPREFHLTYNIAQGNRDTTWTLIDKKSGLPPATTFGGQGADVKHMAGILGIG